MPWTEITRARVSTQWAALRKRSDRCGVGADCPADAAATSIGAAARSRFARGRAGDLLHSVHRLPVASLPSEFPPYSTVQGYFYAWRDTGRWHRIVERPGPASAAETRAQAEADGCRHRQPNGFDDAGRWAAWLRPWQTPLRAQAAHRHRYQRSAAGRPRSSCQRSGRPWRGPVAGAPARALPQASACLCRSGLPRQTARRRTLPLRAVDNRDCRATAAGSKASSSCPSAGLSNAPLHGSAGAVASQETSKVPPPPNVPGFSSPISGS